MPVMATGATGQLALVPDDETAPTALVQSFSSSDVQIKLEHGPQIVSDRCSVETVERRLRQFGNVT